MWLYHRVISRNDADGIANSVDPDQTALWVCTVCPGISVRKLRIITVRTTTVHNLLQSFHAYFGKEDRMWDLIVSVPDHCLSFYFKTLSYLEIRINILYLTPITDSDIFSLNILLIFFFFFFYNIGFLGFTVLRCYIVARLRDVFNKLLSEFGMLYKKTPLVHETEEIPNSLMEGASSIRLKSFPAD